jgi:hypothetical protein
MSLRSDNVRHEVTDALRAGSVQRSIGNRSRHVDAGDAGMFGRMAEVPTRMAAER